MPFDNPAQIAVKEAIDALIHAGTNADLDALDRIYHDDMKILMIDIDGNLARADKPGFIAMLAEMIAKSGEPASTWAHYDAIDADDTQGHVLITRKVKFDGQDQILVLSIDLRHEDGRWQVTREVIFRRPNPEPTPV